MKIENQTLNKSTNHSIITKTNKKLFFLFQLLSVFIFLYIFISLSLFSLLLHCIFTLSLFFLVNNFQITSASLFQVNDSLSLTFHFYCKKLFFLHLIYYIFHVHWGDLLGGWDSFTVRIPPSMSVFEPRKILIFTGWILSQPRLV